MGHEPEHAERGERALAIKAMEGGSREGHVTRALRGPIETSPPTESV
jgi:hypothetical protein